MSIQEPLPEFEQEETPATRFNNLVMKPLLLTKHAWDKEMEAYHRSKGNPEELARYFEIDSDTAGEILKKWQEHYKEESQRHFDEVMAAARSAGEEHPWPYQVWLPLVSECTNHLMIVGETGSGKSFLAKVLLVARSWFGRVVVLDPHAKQPNATSLGDWGITAIGAGRKYGAIAAYMEGLLLELSARYQARSEGREGFEYLNIFIDEWPSIRENCKDVAPRFIKTLSREGRKVHMRLIILSQSERVESLGIRGEGDTKENFSFIYLGKNAGKHLPQKWRDNPRINYLVYRDSGYPILTTGLDQITARYLDLTKVRILPPVWILPEEKGGE